MTDLRDRIASAIARVTAAKAPDAVLAEIAKTHVLVPNRLVEDAYKAGQKIGPGGEQAYARGQVASALAHYWKPEP